METYKRKIKSSQLFEYGIFHFLDHFLGRKRVDRVLGWRRRRYYKGLYKTLEKSGPGKVIEIERRTDLTPEEFKRDYLDKGRPVIWEGGAKDWACVKNWSLDYFQNLYGNDEVVLAGSVAKEVKYEFLTLKDVIENIKSGGDKYYKFYPLLTKHPEHIKDFDYQWLRNRRDNKTMLEEFRVFMGGKGTGTALHSENRGNTFIQVFGEKKWVLIHPHYNAVVDPLPVANAYRKVPLKKEKRFDPFNPVYEGHNALYKYIDTFETTLKPGDILSIPTFHWHGVTNVSHSIGVGYRWFNPIASFKRNRLYMFLDCFATKPPIWKAIKISKEDINLLLVAQGGKLGEYRKEKAEREALRNKSVPQSSKV